jgi:hypothetical protein
MRGGNILVAIRKLLLLISLLLGTAAPLAAQQAVEPAAENEASADIAHGTQKFTCPVGWEQFEQNVNWIGYPLAARPDGGVLGSEYTDVMIPECPGNGMVMVPKHDSGGDNEAAFAPYSPAELTKLPALIASPEYQALLKEARYYRLYWIGKKLGRPAAQQLHLMQHISYIFVPTPEQQRRYLEFFVAETDAILAGGQADEVLQLRFNFFVANALRRLGRFDEARTRIAQINVDASALNGERSEKEPVNPHFESEFEDEDENEPEAGIASIGSELLEAIEAGDTDQHPVSMMGDRIASSICGDIDDAVPPATEMTKRNCAKRVAYKKAVSVKFKEELEAEEVLMNDPAKLAAMCRATPAGKREKTLESACSQSERATMREEIETGAAKLLKNPKALDVQCKSVIIPGGYPMAKTALGEACKQRREVTREAETNALAAEFRKVPSEFARLCTVEYPDQSSDDPTEAACGRIKRERDDARDAVVQARLNKMTEAQIWAECEKTNGGEDAPGYTLKARCGDIESERETAKWKALEADPEKLAATCALPYEKQEKWYRSGCSDLREQLEESQAMAMARDHAALMTKCDATPVLERDDILSKACSSYRKCIIIRFDEMPYHEAASYTAMSTLNGEIPPDETKSVCYETAQEAKAAYAEYVKDPKSLRANSCKGLIDAEIYGGNVQHCEAYARGEDVFAADRARRLDEAAEMAAGAIECGKLHKKRKRSPGDAAASAACAAAEAAK